MHIPPGYAMFIPQRVPQGGRPAGRRRRPLQGSAAGRAGARRGSLRSRRRRPRPDRRRRLRRQGPRRRDRRDPPVPQLQPGVRRPDGPQPLARLHREPEDRPRGRVRRRSGVGATASVATPEQRAGREQARRSGARPDHQSGDGRRRRPGRAAGGDHRGAARAPGDRLRAAVRARRAGAPRGERAQPRRVRRHDPQPAHRVPAARRRRSSTASACGPGSSRSSGRTTSSSPPAPSRSDRGGCPPTPTNVCDVRDVLDRRRGAVAAPSS